MLKFSGSSCLIGGPNESGTVSNADPKGSASERRNEAGILRTFGESRVAAEASAVNNSVRQGARGFVHEIRCTRSMGTPEHSKSAAATPLVVRQERRGASGVNRHSDKHAPRSIPEAQDAFKVLMIHWILQVARRIAFRCVLHRCGSQDIRR